MINQHFTSRAWTHLLALGIALSSCLTPSTSSAAPDQWWEDYVLSERPETWLKSLPEGDSNRRFFQVLHAQVNQSLKDAAQQLKRAEDNQLRHGQLKSLAQRQDLLGLLLARRQERRDCRLCYPGSVPCCPCHNFYAARLRLWLQRRNQFSMQTCEQLEPTRRCEL